MTKWEYSTVQLNNVLKAGLGKMFGDALAFNTDMINEYTNQAGASGWELINVVPTFGSSGTASKLLLFFKRPKA